MLTYAESEKRTFEDFPLTEVDSAILSWLGYAAWPECVCTERIAINDKNLKKHTTSMFRGLYGEERTKRLFAQLVQSPRYCGMEVFHYRQLDDRDRQMQFAAVSFALPDGSTYISYRGTDSSLVGWKEDFNMTYECPIPSQSEALAYLKEVAAMTDGPIHIGGHSKGGNLAVYAAAMADADIQSRMVLVHSHDGPGFPQDFYLGKGYQNIRERIVKTVPQSSMFGMIMNGHEKLTIVKSDSVSFLQHYPLSWRVENSDFVHLEALNADALYFSRVCSAILERLDMEERSIFVDSVYEYLVDAGFSSALNVMFTLPLALSQVKSRVKKADRQKREKIEHVTTLILSAMKDSLNS